LVVLYRTLVMLTINFDNKLMLNLAK